MASRLIWLCALMAACVTGGTEDFDGDGIPDVSDCAPQDPDIHPNADEACDSVDSDCDGDLVDGATDTDADGQPDCVDLDDDGDGSGDAVDCAPLDPAIHPGAAERCDDVDDDCDGDLVGEASDLDGDGLPDCADDDADGDGATVADDCDDLDEDVAPGAAEACDDIDSDCDGDRVDGFDNLDGDALPDCIDPDADGDGSAEDDCDDADEAVHPAAPEGCDGIDTDCDGAPLPGELDGDQDGQAPCAGDCDDNDDTVRAGATEICDGKDNDCAGGVPTDERDIDGDGFRPCAGDCDDGSAALNPVDADADGDSSCGGDCDDHDDSVDSLDDDGDGVSSCDGDCDDSSDLVAPGLIESCDGADNDCDGDVDESTLTLDVPVDGVAGVDYFLGHLPDADPGSGVADFTGATGVAAFATAGDTTTGFRFTDYSVTDRGVVVRAAADGIVTAVPGAGDPDDRQITCASPSDDGNVVEVTHDDGTVTRYTHLRYGSWVVEAGDPVVAGDALAEVGGSGCVVGPELGFEVLACGTTPVDPFSLGLWQQAPGWPHARAVIGVHVRPISPTAAVDYTDGVLDVRAVPPSMHFSFQAMFIGDAGDAWEIEVFDGTTSLGTAAGALAGAAAELHVASGTRHASEDALTAEFRVAGAVLATAVVPEAPLGWPVAVVGATSASWQTAFNEYAFGGQVDGTPRMPLSLDSSAVAGRTALSGFFSTTLRYYAARHNGQPATFGATLANDEASINGSTAVLDSYLDGAAPRLASLGAPVLADTRWLLAVPEAAYAFAGPGADEVPLSISRVDTGTDVLVTALYRDLPGVDWAIEDWVDPGALDGLIAQHANAGRALAWVDGFEVAGVWYLVAIFRADAVDDAPIAEVGLDDDGLLDALDVARLAGRLPLRVTAYLANHRRHWVLVTIPG